MTAVARIDQLLRELKKIPLGERVDDTGRESIDGDEIICPICGEAFDRRNLAEVVEHQHGVESLQ